MDKQPIAKKKYEVLAKVLNVGTKDKKGTPKKVYKRGDSIELTDRDAEVYKRQKLIK